MSDERLVKIMVDVQVPPGQIHVGGVRILNAPRDEELGRAIRTKIVRVADEEHAHALHKHLSKSGFEVEPEIGNYHTQRKG